MMNSVLFSCVIPVKGPRPYFDEAVASLQNQGLGEELEIIIQDGDVEPDAGQSDALNKGFAKAKGEWLFWLNADDVLLPGVLEKVQEFIGGARHVDWIAGDTVYIDAKGIVTDVRRDARWYPWYGRHLSVWTGGPSAFFRRALWERCGGFDESYRFMMDIDLWTRWAKAGERFVGLGDYLWGFRIHKGSLTMGGDNEAAKIEERKRLLTKHNLPAQGFWRNVTRVAQVLDGSWLRRQYDARTCRAVHWREV
jgi:glycosyltransferase involved in cell wall biosynthesis